MLLRYHSRGDCWLLRVDRVAQIPKLGSVETQHDAGITEGTYRLYLLCLPSIQQDSAFSYENMELPFPSEAHVHHSGGSQTPGG